MRYDTSAFATDAYDLLRIINTLNTSGTITDFYSLINNRKLYINTVIFILIRNLKVGRKWQQRQG